MIRIATPADAGPIARVHVESRRAAYGQDEDVPAFEARWVRILGQVAEGRRHWVVEADGEGVGFASAGPARDADRADLGEVYAIYVLPGRWGQGLGRALLDAALGFLRERGHGEAVLWVRADNARARRFYEAAGMAADGGQADEVRYRRRLLPLRVA